MYWLDSVLLIVLAIGATLGAWTGLLRQVARVVTLVVAIYACIHFQDVASRVLVKYVEAPSPVLLQILSYVLIFVVVLALGLVITYLLDKLLVVAKLKPMDRILGSLVGLLKAALIAGALLLGFTIYSTEGTDEVMSRSKIAPVLLRGMRIVIVAVPDRIKDRVSESLERYKQLNEKKVQEELLKTP